MKTLKKKWYAVKCVFSIPNREELGDYLYEERVKLWSASSFEEAFELAKDEAKSYENVVEGIKYLGRADAYEIQDNDIIHGTELWSLQRGSNFSPEAYVKTFVDTQREVGYEVDNDD